MSNPSDEMGLSGNEEDESDSDDDDGPGQYNPTQSFVTAGLRTIQFTKIKRLKIPVPGNNISLDWFSIIQYSFASKYSLTNK